MKRFSLILLSLYTLSITIQCTPKSAEETLSDSSIKTSKEGNLVAAVKQNNDWFFINERGEKLYDKNFTFANEFSNRISCVAEDGTRMGNTVMDAHYYAIDMQGDRIDKIKSDLPFTFSEDRAFVTQDDRTYLIDTQGNVLKFIDGETTTLPMSEGRAVLFNNLRVQFWDKNGEVIKENMTETIGPLHEGLMVFVKDGKYGYMDQDANIVQAPIYNLATSFNDGIASIKKPSGEMFLINKNFETIAGPFQDTRDANEGFIAVKENGLWHYINKEGEQVITEEFKEADSFFEGVAIVINKENQLGYINPNAEFHPIDAKVALGYHNGLAIAEKDGKMGYINQAGEWVIPAKYDRLTNFKSIQ